MEIKSIELTKLKENDWNPNVMKENKYTALARHVKEKGMVQPILVRPKGKGFEIIDGAHRFRATRDANIAQMDCVVVKMTDEQARKATIAMNNIKGYMQDMQLAALIEQLSKDNSLEDLAKALAFDERELRNYLKLLEAPEDFSEMVKQPTDQSVTLTFVVSVKKEKVITKALDKTGADSKGQALAVISKSYLEGKKKSDAKEGDS